MQDKTKKKETQGAEDDIAESLDETMEATRVEAELEAAKQAAQAQAARAEEMTANAQRLQADFDNFRKRNADAIAKARAEGESNLIIQILPALDVFDSALALIADEGIAKGVRMIQRQLEETLATFGVERLPALGSDFDPEFHDAIEQVDSDEESGKIVTVLQQGYRRGDRILRHALVKVAK